MRLATYTFCVLICGTQLGLVIASVMDDFPFPFSTLFGALVCAYAAYSSRPARPEDSNVTTN